MKIKMKPPTEAMKQFEPPSGEVSSLYPGHEVAHPSSSLLDRKENREEPFGAGKWEVDFSPSSHFPPPRIFFLMCLRCDNLQTIFDNREDLFWQSQAISVFRNLFLSASLSDRPWNHFSSAQQVSGWHPLSLICELHEFVVLYVHWRNFTPVPPGPTDRLRLGPQNQKHRPLSLLLFYFFPIC